MPWIRYPFSAAVLAMPLMWGPALIVSVLWLCTFWIGQSALATLVVWWFFIDSMNANVRGGITLDLNQNNWIAIGAVTLNWVILVLWCTRHSRRERRERRNWVSAPPEAANGWGAECDYQQQPFDDQTDYARELSYEEQFEADVQYWQRVQAEASRRLQLEQARQFPFE